MITEDKDNNKILLYVYVSMIVLMITVSTIGTIVISVKSKEEERYIRTSLEEYENMNPMEANEQVETELKAISQNIKSFLYNILLEAMVASIVFIIFAFIEVINKGIIQIAENDYTYSKYSLSIIGISRIVAIVCMFFDIKGTLEEFIKYKQLLDYYNDIFYTLFGFLANIEKQFMR